MRKAPLAVAVLTLLALVPPTVEASHTGPQDFAATGGDGRIILTWTAPTSGAPDAYRLYLALTEDLLAELPSAATRYVHTGLGDGVSVTYRLASVVGGVEQSAPNRTGTTFARTTITSTFSSGADGFTTERSGGGAVVGWQSSSQSLAVGYGSSSTSGDDVIARALPGTSTDRDAAITVQATLRRPHDGWGAALWPLVLTNPGTTDIETRPNTIGIRFIEPPGPTADEEYYPQFWYRDGSGTLHEFTDFFTWECSPDCADHAWAWDAAISYDPHARRISWVLDDHNGPRYSWGYDIGTTSTDGFSVTELAVASDRPGNRAVTFTIDDLTVSWKRSESPPTKPLALAAERPSHTEVALAWSPPLDAGTEALTGYEVRRDGAVIGNTTGTTFTDTTAGRWAYHTYQIRAVNGFKAGPGSASSGVVPMPARHEEHHGFEAEPPTWRRATQWVKCCGMSDVDVFDDQGEAVVGYDYGTYHRYAAPLEGRPWRETTGSFAVESVWYDWGSGLQTGACLLALIPEEAVGCNGPSTIVGETRAENRSGWSPAVARLRYTDQSGVNRIFVNYQVTPQTFYRFNATYDHGTRVLMLRLTNLTGTLLASGSYTIAGGADGFRLGHAGLVSGLGPLGSSPDDGVARIDSFRFTFDSPQPAGVPSPPLGLTADAAGAGRASLSWSAPATAGTAAVAEYLVYRIGTDERRILAGRTTGTTFLDERLLPATRYTYQVAARSTAGEGLLSNRDAALTWGTPGTVNSLIGARGPGAGEITLTWSSVTADPGGAPTDGIEVLRDDLLVATLPPTALTFRDTDRTAGAFHRYDVRGVNAIGAGPAKSITVQAPTRPSQVFITSATPGPGSGEATVKWRAPFTSGGIAYDYVVRRSLDGGPFAIVATPGTVLEWRDTCLPTGAAVTYTVAARNAVGEGLQSPQVATRAPALPGAPAALATLRGPGAGQIRLTWNAPSDTGGIPLTGYRVYRDGTFLGQTTARAFTDAGLPAGSSHDYEVTAVNPVGEGVPASATGIVPAVPSAPQLLAAESGPTLGRVTLTWSAPADDGGIALGGYAVYRNGVLAGTASGLTFEDFGLADGTSYAYEVAARNAVGEGPRASDVARTWSRVAPGPVLALKARNAGLGLIEVTWSAPAWNGGPPVQQYLVYRVGGLTGETLAATITDGTRFLDSSTKWITQPAAEYEYRVVAVNEVGGGAAATSNRASPLRP